MIDYDALKELFGTSLPEAHIFFATHGVRRMGLGYARLRKELGLSSAHTNRKIWKLFEAKYATETEETTVAVTGVTMSPKTLNLAPGTSASVLGTVAPANATNKAVTYTSSSPATVVVAANGTCTAAPSAVVGTTVTITVTTDDGAKTDTAVVTIVEAA